MAKLLIVDDNEQILQILSRYAQAQGHQAVLARTGPQALEAFAAQEPDLVLLDVMLPGMDGFAVCREIRARSLTPVIMITARSDDEDRILGLDTGADDYVVKPFSPGEVMARVRAVLRRVPPPAQPDVFRCGGLEIDLQTFGVRVAGQPVALTRRAAEILWTLARRPRQVFTREMLLDLLWGPDYLGDVRAVDSQIKRMRSALAGLPGRDFEIRTVWGVGYQFEAIQ